jgi:hypothetical protein
MPAGLCYPKARMYAANRTTAATPPAYNQSTDGDVLIQ